MREQGVGGWVFGIIVLWICIAVLDSRSIQWLPDSVWDKTAVGLEQKVERYYELNACYMDTRCRMTVEEFAEFRRLREEMSRP